MLAEMFVEVAALAPAAAWAGLLADPGSWCYTVGIPATITILGVIVEKMVKRRQMCPGQGAEE